MDYRDAWDNRITPPTALKIEELKENLLSSHSATLIDIFDFLI